MTVQAIAAAIGVRAGRVRDVLQRAGIRRDGRRTADAQRRAILELHAAGCSQRQIAARLHTSARTVCAVTSASQ
jgi:DNA-binding NarL/FixJ family response regulator